MIMGIKAKNQPHMKRPSKSIESAQAIAVAVKTRLAEDSPLRPKIDSRLALFTTTRLNRLLGIPPSIFREDEFYTTTPFPDYPQCLDLHLSTASAKPGRSRASQK